MSFSPILMCSDSHLMTYTTTSQCRDVKVKNQLPNIHLKAYYFKFCLIIQSYVLHFGSDYEFHIYDRMILKGSDDIPDTRQFEQRSAIKHIQLHQVCNCCIAAILNSGLKYHWNEHVIYFSGQ